MIDYDDFVAAVKERKRARWVAILAAEPPGRAPGRRPRDPEQERLLLRLDRARRARLAAGGSPLAVRSSPDGCGSDEGTKGPTRQPQPKSEEDPGSEEDLLVRRRATLGAVER